MFRYGSLLLFMAILVSPALFAERPPVQITVHWGQVIRVSETHASLVYIATPNSKRGAPLHDPMLKAIKELGPDYIRYSPCNNYPHLTIAELQPPGKDSTSWDFSHVDPMTEDVMKELQGHPFILNFSTIPEWMFKTPKPVSYPSDPDQLDFNYEQGTELRVSDRKVANYFARIVSWYVKGGFRDELGKWHESGHHYKVPYWEVLNEPNIEHQLTPQVYTRLYDAIVTAIRKVSPQTKFVGMVNSYPATNAKYFEYFLDPRHHQPGIPLDAVSFHFYAGPEDSSEPEKDYPLTFFEQADGFLSVVSYIDVMRDRLSPATRIMVDELGAGLPNDGPKWRPTYASISPSYWNLSAALYAYLFAGLAVRGADLATASMMPAYPGQYPDLALINWETGRPNARYYVLKMIHDNFPPGDKIVETSGAGGYLMAQAFTGPGGERKLLLVNKNSQPLRMNLPGAVGAKMEVVDLETGSSPPRTVRLESSTFDLGGFGVAVVTLGK